MNLKENDEQTGKTDGSSEEKQSLEHITEAPADPEFTDCKKNLRWVETSKHLQFYQPNIPVLNQQPCSCSAEPTLFSFPFNRIESRVTQQMHRRGRGAWLALGWVGSAGIQDDQQSLSIQTYLGVQSSHPCGSNSRPSVLQNYYYSSKLDSCMFCLTCN